MTLLITVGVDNMRSIFFSFFSSFIGCINSSNRSIRIEVSSFTFFFYLLLLLSFPNYFRGLCISKKLFEFKALNFRFGFFNT